MKLKTKTKIRIQQSLRWSVFIMAALTTGLKIAETAAYGTLQVIAANPEVGQFANLVNDGYLLF